MQLKRLFVTLALISALAVASSLAGPAPAHAVAPEPSPGVYAREDGSAGARLEQQGDGSWEMVLWQGAAQDGPGQGFALMARLLPTPDGEGLSGSWQALPGSCCPGRGRLGIAPLDETSFRFTAFAPSLDAGSWPVAGGVFRRVGDLPAPPGPQRLAGAWRASLAYTDILPGGGPADPVEGLVTLEAQDQGLAGAWSGWPGRLTLTPGPQGAELTYQDQAGGYELSASLSPVAGGLALTGPFRSTLGQGRLQLVRAGLPADPPGARPEAGGSLAGTWVDPRTGDDYFQIKGSEAGFDFTAYGGALAQPRYLTRGQARPQEPGVFAGQARDVEGYCCGNQGRLAFRRLEPDKLEVSSFWWPLGRPDPGSAVGQPYVIQRVRRDTAEAAAPVGQAARWPLVRAAQPGLLDPAGGAVKAAFTWRPGSAARECTIFSQGGYRRDLDLWVGPEGRLMARIFTAGGPVELAAEARVSPGQTHTAWLVYEAGGQARLFLDGRQAAAGSLPQPWAGSRAPYLVGASRWPGRAFSGDIEQVALFATPQDPAQPGEPSLVITPAPAPAEAQEPSRQAARVVSLERLWHPGRLVHAYAVRPEQIQRLEQTGFVRQGAVGGILEGPVEGTTPLWAFRHRGQGYTLLSTSEAAPPGCDSLGRLGWVWSQPGEGAVALTQLQAALPEPLRGGQSQDILYTTREEAVAAAQRAGYGPPQVVAQVKSAGEPAYAPPALFSWPGRWRGDGWGRFFVALQGRELDMYWHYGQGQGPSYFGRYRLSPDGRRAEGVAMTLGVNHPTYYRHLLEFDTQSAKGPRVKLTSWRLAAPLDDGRLVRFKKPTATSTLLIKEGQDIPPEELAPLSQAAQNPDPAQALDAAIRAAQAQGRLLER